MVTSLFVLESNLMKFEFKKIGSVSKGENGLDKQKRLLAELLNKNQLYVNLSEIDDRDFATSEEDKELNRTFYNDP